MTGKPMSKQRSLIATILSLAVFGHVQAEDLPPISPVHEREAEFYKLVDLPIPETINLEASSILPLADKQLAIGTRRGDIYFVAGLRDKVVDPQYKLFATGLHEILGMDQKDGDFYVTQQGEVTRIQDIGGDDCADSFTTVSDGWGFGAEHEFTFGSRFDREGFIWTVHCLSGSYTSDHKFRGWCLRISPDGRSIPTCSGIRSPGGIGMNSAGDMFYTENQGPWNGACSLKHLKPGHFMGHPISFKWYPQAPNMGAAPQEPNGGREHRQHIEAQRIPELVPPAVVFPYKKMGQSASAISLDQSDGRFGPFAGQLFVADYTLSLLMRVDLEFVDGVYQGACFPFREGFHTGLLGATFTEEGYYFAGGSSRAGWPTRGVQPYSLQRLEWTGKLPFEIREMKIRPDGFELIFTKPVDPKTATASSFNLRTYTHIYQPGYGSPEVDQTFPKILLVEVDGSRVRLKTSDLQIGHVHELTSAGVRSLESESLLHDVAYYTLNRLPKQ